MPVGRPSPAPVCVFEPLEQRQLLTLVVGTFNFEYVDQEGHRVQIRVDTNSDSNGGADDTPIEVEFVWARPTKTGSLKMIQDHNDTLPEDALGADLFAIYVSESDKDDTIIIAEVPDEDEEDRTMRPFEGSIGPLRVNDAQTGESITVSAPGNSGNIILGTKTKAIEDQDDSENKPKPKKEGMPFAFGDTPVNGNLRAGLEIANGNNFGKFLFGGTIIGDVHATGSIDTFYCGWLLSGKPRGQTEGNPGRGRNFRVDRDLRNLIVMGSIGTSEFTDSEPEYVTGFDLRVDGRVGQIKTGGSYLGFADIKNAQNIDNLGGNFKEIESHVTDEDAAAGLFEQGLLNDSFFYNDTFDTPQYLGSRGFAELGDGQHAIVEGVLQSDEEQDEDYSDYYAMGLMAGRMYTVELIAGDINLGVFDPQGRLIATDYGVTGAFRFKAETPGIYRFAIALEDDGDFDGPGGEFEGEPLADFSYQLEISNVGKLGLGAIVAEENIFDGGSSSPVNSNEGFRVDDGDLGALAAGDKFFSQAHRTVDVRNGNFRAARANEFAIISNPASANPVFEQWPRLHVPQGSVGLLQSDARLAASAVDRPIGGDLQTIISGGTLFLDEMLVDQGIGTIRAQNMATENQASIITVNADNRGRDGIIDLIDVEGDLGTLEVGGPQITTGLGGNVRYMRVGGDVFRDIFFGEGDPEGTVLEPGESARLNDDSGGRIRLQPGSRINPAFNPNQPVGPGNLPTIDETLTVTTYGIRGSGGVVVVKVESTGSIDIRGDGLAGDATVEVGEVVSSGTAGPFRIGLDGVPEIDPRALSNDVTIHGTARTDVFAISGGSFTRVTNSSGGEMVSVSASSIGELRGRYLGLAKRNTGAVLMPTGIEVGSDGAAGMGNTYPFLDQRFGISVSGDVLDASATRGLGNLMVGGTLWDLTANSDQREVNGEFEGIVAPVVVGGDAPSVFIGEGIAPSGTGNLALAGLFVAGDIGTVRNAGGGSNIRGNIISNSNINRISINGSIIDSVVRITTDFFESRAFHGVFLLPLDSEIGSITIQGKGGIIGSTIGAANIGMIRVRDGFGIFTSEFDAAADGSIAGMEVGGYGIRTVEAQPGANMGDITLLGNGRSVPTSDFSSAVRQSENRQFDRFSGQELSSQNDINVALGVNEAVPEQPGVTNTGMIVSSTFVGSRNLGRVTAFRILGVPEQENPFDPNNPIPRVPSVFSFANRIEAIETSDNVNVLDVTTGELVDINIGGRTINSNVTVAGPLRNGVFQGDIGNDSIIQAVGANGEIGRLVLEGNVSGGSRVFVRGTSDEIIVKGDLLGALIIEATRADNDAARRIELYKTVADDAIDIEGDVDEFIVRRSLGSVINGEGIIDGDVRMIHIGAREEHDGAEVLTDLIITGDVDEYIIDGVVLGDLRVGGKLNSLTINADGESPNSILQGDFRVDGGVDFVTVNNGNVSGSFIARNTINSFIINDGNLTAGALIRSQQGDIDLVRAVNGEINGDVEAPNGTVGTVEEV